MSESPEKWYVYILECSDETLYTGITNNLELRLKKHNQGKGARYTKGRGPVKLLINFEVDGKSKALKLEYKIKKLSKKEKIEIIKNRTLLDSTENEVIFEGVKEKAP